MVIYTHEITIEQKFKKEMNVKQQTELFTITVVNNLIKMYLLPALVEAMV